MKDLAEKFGQNLRTARKAKELSQNDLALQANIDLSYVGRVERGEANVTLDKVYQFAEALGCSAHDLLP